MLYCFMLCYAVLCYDMLCYDMLCHVMIRHGHITMSVCLSVRPSVRLSILLTCSRSRPII